MYKLQQKYRAYDIELYKSKPKLSKKKKKKKKKKKLKFI